MNILKKLREDSGRDPKDLARAGGIGVEAYFDLETHDDELKCAISIGHVGCIARELGVRPSMLYGGTSSRTVSVEQLAAVISDFVTKNGKSLPEFEDEVGWQLAAALDNPKEFLNFNADGLQAVCGAVGISWFDVLDGTAA